MTPMIDEIIQLNKNLKHALSVRAAFERIALCNHGDLVSICETLNIENDGEKAVAAIKQLQAENAKLKDELESHAWEISPAMAQAKIDELNREYAKLKSIIALLYEDALKTLMEAYPCSSKT